MKWVAKKYDCEKYMAFRHTVTAAEWKEDDGKWEITVQNETKEFRDECDVLINAGGVLR